MFIRQSVFDLDRTDGGIGYAQILGWLRGKPPRICEYPKRPADEWPQSCSAFFQSGLLRSQAE